MDRKGLFSRISFLCLSSIGVLYNSLPRERTKCTTNVIGAAMLTLLGSRAVSGREVKFRLRIKEGLKRI